VTFRTRILLACIAVAVTPLVVFSLGARRVVRDRLSTQSGRCASSSAKIQENLDRQSRETDQALRTLAQQIEGEPQVRAALLGRTERTALLDYAPSVMRQVGLDYLVLLDSAGTILSSGSFRNDFDRRTAILPALLSAEGSVLVQTRRPEGNFLALARAHGFSIGDQRFALAGGVQVDSGFVRALIPPGESGVVATLAWPADTLRSDTARIGLGDAWSQDSALTYLDDVADSAAPGCTPDDCVFAHRCSRFCAAWTAGCSPPSLERWSSRSSSLSWLQRV
jgi:hypothetical protein